MSVDADACERERLSGCPSPHPEGYFRHRFMFDEDRIWSTDRRQGAMKQARSLILHFTNECIACGKGGHAENGMARPGKRVEYRTEKTCRPD